MKRHLVVAGRGLAGIGLASGLGYLAATKASNPHYPPVWPYLICAGVLIAGMALYSFGEAQSSPNPGQEEQTTQEEEAAHEQVAVDPALNGLDTPAFTSRWSSSANGFEVGPLIHLRSASFSDWGYMPSANEMKSSLVRIRTLIACDPLKSTTAGTEWRSRFRAFLAQPAIMSLVAEMTHVDRDEKWISLAGNGSLMLQASLMANDQDADKTPFASATIFLPSVAQQASFGRDPNCAELRLHIKPQTADGRPTPPVKLVNWQDRFARALAVPRLLAAFLSDDLGLTTSDDPRARFGILLEAPGPLTELIDIGGLKTLPGDAVRNQFVSWAHADPSGSPAAVTAREFMTQLCEHALNLDNYEWALLPIDQ